MPRRATAAACALGLLLGSCGSDDGDGDPPPAAGERGADLTVTVRPEGADGPVRTRRIRCARLGAEPASCRRLAGLRPAQLEPVPRETICAQIYGGPAVARVRGELRGKRVDASFERSNGCEIERWDRNRVLLGDAGR